MKYYVYLYLNEVGTAYYVGKGTGSRCTDDHGSIPIPREDRILKVLETDDEKEAFEKEKQLIEYHGREADGGTLLNKVVPTGKSSKRAGAFNANFKPDLLKKYKQLCRDKGLQYTKVLENFAEHYVMMNGEVEFLKHNKSNEPSVTDRLDRLEKAMVQLTKNI
jgi:hypothetical protein